MHTVKPALAPCALLILAAPALASDISAVVDFESGVDGWSGPSGPGGATNIDPTGGNGGGAGLRTVFNDFGITFRTNTNAAFLGDLSQHASVTISVDTRVDDISFFGTPAPRPWLVELRDYDAAVGGFPWSSVWYLFDNISAANNSNYTTYSVTIADPMSTTLPAGWEGYGAEDPMTFEPILPAGVTFADILSGVDEVVFTTLQPGFFFGFTDFDVTLDNITIVRESIEANEFCNGDGGDQMGCTDCPCGNNAPQGTIGGCTNSAGTSTRLLSSGSDSVAAADLRFEGSGAPPNNSAVLTSGNALAPANMANPCFGLNSGVTSISLDGLRCAVQGVLRHGVRPSDANGDIGVTTNGWGTPNGFFNFSAFTAGDTKHFQIIHRDDAGAVCNTGQNTSQAVSVTFTP